MSPGRCRGWTPFLSPAGASPDPSASCHDGSGPLGPARQRDVSTRRCERRGGRERGLRRREWAQRLSGPLLSAPSPPPRALRFSTGSRGQGRARRPCAPLPRARWHLLPAGSASQAPGQRPALPAQEPEGPYPSKSELPRRPPRPSWAWAGSGLRTSPPTDGRSSCCRPLSGNVRGGSGASKAVPEEVMAHPLPEKRGQTSNKEAGKPVCQLWALSQP